MNTSNTPIPVSFPSCKPSGPASIGSSRSKSSAKTSASARKITVQFNPSPVDQTVTHLTERIAKLEAALALYARAEALDRELHRREALNRHVLIIAAICRVCAVCQADLIGPSHCQDIADARQIAMTLLRETGLTLDQVGSLFQRTHTTARYAIQAVANKESTDPIFRAKVQNVRAALI